MQIIQLIQVMQVMEGLHVLQVMQLIQVSQVMQVMQVSLAHLWVDFRVIFADWLMIIDLFVYLYSHAIVINPPTKIERNS